MSTTAPVLAFTVLLCFVNLISGKQRQPYLNHYEKIEEDFSIYNYQPYEKIEEELLRISEKGNDRIMKSMVLIGKTFEGRNLLALQMTNLDNIRNKKRIVVDCGAHAREWIAPATCMYIIKKFSGYCCESVIKKFNWVFIPILNPDGYKYTWKNNKTRMWRKNRSYTKSQLQIYNRTKNELCIGTDINRNFDVKWGGMCLSVAFVKKESDLLTKEKNKRHLKAIESGAGAPVNNPCYEMYAGSSSFSERESTALANYLNKTRDNIIAYVSLHTYGQSWMTPYGFTKKRPKAYDEMERVAKIAVETMRNYSGVKYEVGPSHDALYPNSGSSVDWAYKELDIPYTYVVEMMPNGNAGKKVSFLSPPSMMVKNAKDLLQGIKAMALNLKT